MILALSPDAVHEITHLSELIPDNLGVNALYMQHYAARLLPACRLYVYRDSSNQPLGYTLAEKGGHIFQIAVDPLSRNIGIGRALLDHAIAEQACGKQTLYVRDDNHVAKKFYKRMGFVREGKTVLERDGSEFIMLYRRKQAQALLPKD